ncbi:hypothetical protein LY78DRAFT_349893 [Colletotrichum sublineola]|nr:hypothetical protein LY78DRAFT_349893 [Colletotrichum sublineola]
MRRGERVAGEKAESSWVRARDGMEDIGNWRNGERGEHCETFRHNADARVGPTLLHLTRPPITTSAPLSCLKSHSAAGCLNGLCGIIVLTTSLPPESSPEALFLPFRALHASLGLGATKFKCSPRHPLPRLVEFGHGCRCHGALVLLSRMWIVPRVSGCTTRRDRQREKLFFCRGFCVVLPCGNHSCLAPSASHLAPNVSHRLTSFGNGARNGGNTPHAMLLVAYTPAAAA